MEQSNRKKAMVVYFVIVALTALALSMSNDVMSNYFKDAYNVTSFQRGLIEFPRELPGVLLIFIVAGLSFMSDLRIAMVSQVLSMIGILILAFFTPSYSWMLVYLFINSMGMHLFFPLQDSIGLSMVSQKNVGKRMGQFKGVYTGFMMVGYAIVFLGFRYDIFSFKAPVKWIFILCGAVLFVILFLFVWLEKLLSHPPVSEHRVRIFFRKEYKYYYILVIMYGVQKQMMMVYGPWVIIEILGRGADVMALLSMIGACIGIFFIPAVGYLMDLLGVKKLLYADALSFIAVYGVYGFMSGKLYNGSLPLIGWPVMFMFVLFIIDKMSTQLGMVRSVYLKSILVDDKDLTPTLSLGISMDHVMSIIFAIISGWIWKLWGPQYVFYMVGLLSFVNLYVAIKVKPVEKDGLKVI